jgi:hypothetical protein
MEVLVFTNPKDPAKERFFHEISEVPTLSPRFVFEHGRFVDLIKRSAIDWGAIVFFALEQDDLSLALSLKECLAASRVIMVLQKKDAQMVKQGLSLSPCFITFATSNLGDVVAVLEKYSTNNNNNHSNNHNDDQMEV